MPRLPMWRRHQRIHGPDPRRDVDEELAFHLDERVEHLRQQGLDEQAARREAEIRFGDRQRVREAYVAMAARRSARQAIVGAVQAMLADVRYAWRVFTRAPGFALAVVFVAGLGIAVNGTVFAALNGLFMRPLPLPRPHEIVRVYTSNAGNGGLYGASSYPDYLELRQAPSLAGLAAYVPLSANLRIGTITTRAEGRLVSDNFFGVLGVAPGIGRLFSADDASRVDAPPAVLSHACWRRQFNADPGIVGTLLDVNGGRAVVVGITGPDFTGIETSQVDIYFPISAQPVIAPGVGFADQRAARLVRLIGRLAPGASEGRAASDLTVLMQGLGTTYPDTNRGRIVTVHRASSLIDVTAAKVPLVPLVVVVFTITGLLLLIATVNIAGLLLARTVSRRRELAVRLSLGASRGRLLRQLITESLVLAAAAELVALALLAALPVVARSMSIPETVRVGLDLPVLGFATVLTLVTALGFSLGPALKGSSRDPYGGLRDSQSTMPLARARGQRVLVVVQVTLSIVLLAASVLLAQSIRRQYTVDPGFVTSHLLAAEFEFERGIASREEERQLAQEALRQVRVLPGVEHATVTISPPLTSEGARMSVDIPGFQARSGETLEIPFSYAGADYAATLGLRLLAGEELRSDRVASVSRRVLLVNETMARTYWPGRNPIGATVRLGGSDGPAVPVAAVVSDARMVSLSRGPGPFFYVQTDGGAGATLMVRTGDTAGPVQPVLQRLFAAGVRGFALQRVRPMEDVIGASLAEARALAAVTSAISALALILAVSALYGLVNYLTAQRTREFGIRLALGATRGDLARLVLSTGLRLAAIGISLGLLASFIVAAALHSLLFAVSAVDAAAVTAAAVVAAVVSVAACLPPALRASSILPATILRAE